MSDEAAIRRQNLKRLMASRGWDVATLPTTEGLGFSSYSYWRDLLKDSKKSFGEKVARRIEEKAGLTRGWMDEADAAIAPARPPASAPEHEPTDHEMAFALLSPEEQIEVHAITVALLVKNPNMAKLMKQAGVSTRADDAKVAMWKAKIDSGEFALPKQAPSPQPQPDGHEKFIQRQSTAPKKRARS